MKAENSFTRTLNRQCFIGYLAQSAVAGNYGHTQLRNPAASGKILILDQVITHTTSPYVLRQHNVALTTNDGVEANKYLTGAAPVGILDRHVYVAMQGTGLTQYVTNNEPFLTFKNGIAIPEGWGVIVMSNTVNVALYVTFQWFEIT